MDLQEKTNPTVSLVVPFRDAGQAVDEFLAELKTQVQALAEPFELIFVDDGSNDGAAARLENEAKDSSVKIIMLSGSFGFDSAVLAGLSHASGQAIVWMPVGASNALASLKAMLAKFREGTDVVSLVQPSGSEGKTPKCPFKCLIHGQAEDTGCDTMLVSQAAARAMCENAIRFARLAELVKWIGFTRGQVEAAAPAGKSKGPAKPAALPPAECADPHGLIRKAYLVGMLLMAAGVIYMIIHAGAIVVKCFLPGWAFVLAGCAVLFGMQFFAMSVLLFRLCQITPTRAAGLGYVVRKTVGFTQHHAAGQSEDDDDDDIRPFMLWT